MNLFLLQHAHPFIYKKLDFYTDSKPIATSPSLAQYLYEIKEKIKQFNQEWDIYKEYTNPFEYIHTVVPPLKHAISTYRPLSRSYFKMVEIITHFEMMKLCSTSEPCHTFHLAEGPGGFIEAFVNQRKTAAPMAYTKDKYVGMTLIDDADKMIPSWKKSQTFLKNNPTVSIEYGTDETGNLLSLHNFIGAVHKYGSSMHFVTADGGFDFSDNFNKQEQKITNLLFAQIAYALCTQKKGGTFVLKVFDCFAEATIDLLYLLSSMYEKVYVTKPQTSRYANSERYIVCMHFHFEHYSTFYPHILSAFTKMCCTPDDRSVQRFFAHPLPMYYLNRLEESNIVIGMNQIENIYATISLMENKASKKSRMEYLIKTHVAKCIHWCAQHNVPILPSLAQRTIGYNHCPLDK